MRKLTLVLLLFILINNANAQWQKIFPECGSSGGIYAFVNNGQYFFAASGSQNNRNMIRSSNNGTNWQIASNGLYNYSVRSIAAINGNLFAGTSNTYRTVYMSTNNGIYWSEIYNGDHNQDVNSIIGKGIYLFIATDSVFRTSNIGQTWVNLNIKANILFTDSSDIYAGSYGIIKKSTNDGNYWITSSSGIPLNATTSSFCKINNNIFAGTNRGLFVSSNSGSNWQPIYNELPSNSDILSMVTYNSILFVGIRNNGVYMSTNYGTNWFSKNQGFPIGLIQSVSFLTLGISGNYIYANQFDPLDSGIYRRTLSEIILINKISSSVPEEYLLSQNYPNPFNPSTNIKFQIKDSRFTILKVYDIQGKEIETLVNEKLSSGSYSVDWNASKYPSGIYFYRIIASDFVETKKMTLIK